MKNEAGLKLVVSVVEYRIKVVVIISRTLSMNWSVRYVSLQLCCKHQISIITVSVGYM